ncbi:Dyp-type peroxidase [Variovorax sp. HJSM1_2]|uniref:Dyp-type peroxidase n=1 Tax=Variovorax sp. HJSM1_2 TaxID=3366263 RepID=UPI003BD716D2
MKNSQAGIMASVPTVARYAFFSVNPKADAAALRQALGRLQALADGDKIVVGIGPLLTTALGVSVPGLREMPHLNEHGVDVPSTPTALWCWLRGSDRGALVLLTHSLENAVAPALHLDRVVDAFRHGEPSAQHGRDLTGYEDGTENPEGEAAEAAAFVQGQGAGLDGASFVAVQQWVHDLNAFEAMATVDQDNAMGRRRSDNEELEDAPETSHVKRTAQESFDPEAFVLRRSMPWAMSNKLGLLFVAFGHTLNSFEAQMRRMAGYEDGLLDSLFKFSKPVNGAYLWCPPVQEGKLDLRQLGL